MIRKPELIWTDVKPSEWFPVEESIETVRDVLRKLEARNVMILMTPETVAKSYSDEEFDDKSKLIGDFLKFCGVIVSPQLPLHYFERLDAFCAKECLKRVSQYSPAPLTSISSIYQEYFLKFGICSIEIAICDPYIIDNLGPRKHSGAEQVLTSLTKQFKRQAEKPLDLQPIGDKTICKQLTIDSTIAKKLKSACEDGNTPNHICRLCYEAALERLKNQVGNFGEGLIVNFNAYDEFHLRCVDFYFVPYRPDPGIALVDGRSWRRVGFGLSKGLESFRCPSRRNPCRSPFECTCASEDPLIGILDERMLQIVDNHLKEIYFHPPVI